jgi:hypothetical protein
VEASILIITFSPRETHHSSTVVLLVVVVVVVECA